MRKAMIALFIVSLASGLSAQTSGGMQTATVTLSAAQLQTLRESPVILIPAPGAGQAINVASATLQYNAGHERYAGGPRRSESKTGPYAGLRPSSVLDRWLTT